MQDPEVVADALDLIARGTRSASSLENQRLDFKTDKPSDRESHQDLAEAAVCFVNASGGAPTRFSSSSSCVRSEA